MTLPATRFKKATVKKLSTLVDKIPLGKTILKPALDAIEKLNFDSGVKFASEGAVTGYKNLDCKDSYYFPVNKDNKAKISGTAFITAGYTHAFIEDLLKKHKQRQKQLEKKQKELESLRQQTEKDIGENKKDIETNKKELVNAKNAFEEKKANQIEYLKKKRNRITGSGANEKKKKISAQIKSIEQQKTNNKIKELKAKQENLADSLDYNEKKLKGVIKNLNKVSDALKALVAEILEINKKIDEAKKDAENKVDISLGGERTYSLVLKGAKDHIHYSHEIEGLKVTGKITLIILGKEWLPFTKGNITYGEFEIEIDEGFQVKEGKWIPQF